METNPCAQLLARIKLIQEQAATIRLLWQEITPAEPPSDFILKGWLKQFGFDAVEAGLEALAVKCQKIAQQQLEGKEVEPLTTATCIKYASAVMWEASGMDAGRPQTERRKRAALKGRFLDLSDELKEKFCTQTPEEAQKLIACKEAQKKASRGKLQ